jgi:hypothetical protein
MWASASVSFLHVSEVCPCHAMCRTPFPFMALCYSPVRMDLWTVVSDASVNYVHVSYLTPTVPSLG